MFERQRDHKRRKETDRWERRDERFDSHHADCVTLRAVSTNLMSRQRSMGSAAVPSTQMVKPTSSRVVVRMVRLTSEDVSLTARLNATAPLKPESREDISEQAGLTPSIKPPGNHLPTNYLKKAGERYPVNNPVCLWVTDHTVNPLSLTNKHAAPPQKILDCCTVVTQYIKSIQFPAQILFPAMRNSWGRWWGS